MLISAAPALNAEPVEQYYQTNDFYRVQKIDAHMHLDGTYPPFFSALKKYKFKALTINVDYADFPPIDEQQQVALQLLATYPHLIAFATTFSVKNFEQPGWTEETERRIDSAVAHGAIGVKFWKNIGMDLKDDQGHMVMIDDSRFTNLINYLEEKGIPLLGHQGEPQNCWLPVSEMTVENDREYFTSHPQYHMYLHPEFPSYEDQIRARNNMLGQHPNLKFIGMHMASLEWSTDELSQFLDKYPQANVDIAARMAQIQVQTLQDQQKVRRFFIQYQDRLMYGTDTELAKSLEKNGQNSQNSQSFIKDTLSTWLSDWRFFTGNVTMKTANVPQPVQGLHLPKTVIDKLYRINAEKQYPTAWH
jgi:hypothetical protein